MVPKLYTIKHPRTPFLVIYTDGATGKRVRRHFKERGAAEAHLADLQKRMAYEGTAGLAMDAAARAQFFGARRALDDAGLEGMSLIEVAREFVRLRPGKPAVRVDALEAVEEFVRDRRRENLARRTVENLEKRCRQFVDGCRIGRLSEAGPEVLRDWVYREGVSARTQINDRAALNRFFRWAVRRNFMGENPVAGIDKPRADDPPPRVFAVEEARALMRAAEEFREGRFAKYFAVALFAGLRPSEIEAMAPDAWSPAAKVLRVRGGKARGRANRFAPVTDNLKAWLRVFRKHPFFPQPFRPGFEAVRELAGRTLSAERAPEPFPWQEDVCRHSFISYRLAQVGDEVRVAREAGNSPEIIYREYFELRSKAEARRFFGVRPNAASGR